MRVVWNRKTSNMRTTVLFYFMIGAAFALPADTTVKSIPTTPEGHILKTVKSELTDEPQSVKTVNKIPIYGPEAINELNYDYVKVPYYPYSMPYYEPYNKNYLNEYPATGAPFGTTQYYPHFYPERSYYPMKNYFSRYSPFYPTYGSKYAYHGSQYQMPQYYKQVPHSIPFIGLEEKAEVPAVPLAIPAIV